MAATLTTLSNLLKEVYEPNIRSQLQDETVASKRIESSSDGIDMTHNGGKYVKLAIEVERNHGVGSRGEMEALPEAENMGYENPQIKLPSHYGSIQLSGNVIRATDKDYQAFAKAMESEMDGLRKTLSKDFNRQIWGTKVGILGTATSDGGDQVSFVTTNAQYFEIGMVVDVYDVGGTITSTGSKRKITNIEDDTPTTGDYTITLDSAVGTNILTDFTLTRHGSKNKEISGLTEILNISGNYDALYGVTHYTWTPNLDTTGGAPTEGSMRKMADKIRRRGGKVSVILCDDGMQRSYANLLIQQRRYADPKEFTGGFSGLAFLTSNGEVPVVCDLDAPPNTMNFFDEGHLKVYQEDDWSWLDKDGSLWKQVTDSNGSYDAYRATLQKDCQLGTDRRNTHGAMTGLTSG